MINAMLWVIGLLAGAAFLGFGWSFVSLLRQARTTGSPIPWHRDVPASPMMRVLSTAVAVVLAAGLGFYSTAYFVWAAYVDAADAPRQPLGTVLCALAAVLPLAGGRWRYRRKRRRAGSRLQATRSAALVYAGAAFVLFIPVVALSAAA